MQVPVGRESARPLDPLSRKELISYRLLLGVACAVILAVGVLIRRAELELVDPWTERLIVAGLIAAVLGLSFARQDAPFRYGMVVAGYVTTFWIVRLLALNDFDEQFALGLLVAFPAVSMLFWRRRHLLWYGLTTVALVGVAAAATPEPRIPRDLYLVYVGTVALLSFLILGARLDATEALTRSEERFRLLLQNVRDYGIFRLDPEGRIREWNAGAERITGFSAEQIEGRHLSVFHTPASVAVGSPEEQLETAASEGRSEDEGWRLRKDGTAFWAHVVLTRLEENGHLVGFAAVARDLSDRRAAQERALADARRLAEAEAVSRAKSEFLATLSHELRTPLNAIAGYIELLSIEVPGPVNEAQAEYLGRIRANQRNLLAIINDLLHFSTIEAGEIAYDCTPTPLGPAIEGARRLIEPQAERKGIRMEWPPGGDDTLARADLPRVEQILLNLLKNAVTFTEEGGTISVSREIRQDRVVIRVADTGSGIEAEHLGRIFDPFVQLGRSFSSPREGTGLGLAISRDLARGMDGDLTVRSTVGAGSTFFLELPRAESAVLASRKARTR